MTSYGKKVKKVIRYGLYLFVIYLIQAEVMTYIRLMRTTPLLLPMAAVGVAMFETPEKAGVLGLFAGMLCDVSFNEPAIKFTLLLTVVCMVVPVLCDVVLNRGFPAFCLMCAGTLLLSAFIQMLPLIFIHGVKVSTLMLSAVFQLIYSLLYTVPLYFAARKTAR